MCGRYALSLRPSIVRERLEDYDLAVDEAPADDDERIRQTYNFAPGYHGLIYRAATADHGGNMQDDAAEEDGEPARKRAKVANGTASHIDGRATKATKYKLQAARWGLIPFWTKRAPDYSSQLKTINARDDSLIENRGMWNTMKQRKRCIVIAEGFYEWLKKNDGKDKLPHFTKRRDGQLMCFAGLWDMVQYEGSEEKLYTYTVITTDSNQQLKFLHDRMPVILEPGSEGMKMWLDPNNVGWSKDLQSLLKPFAGELDCYPVDKAVGKVGNNSPTFVVSIDSKENKNNIANFFGSQAAKKEIKKEEAPMKDEKRVTTSQIEGSEDNAPLPKPEGESDAKVQHALDDDTEVKNEPDAKQDAAPQQALAEHEASTDEVVEQNIKQEIDAVNDKALLQADLSSQTSKHDHKTPSPVKKTPVKPQSQSSIRKARNATSNMTVAKTPSKDSNAKITSFFGK